MHATEDVFGDPFSRVCAWIAIFGAFAALATDVVGVWVADDVSFVADTISDLAAGRHAWIQDVGLYAFAFGMVAVAVGLLRGRLGKAAWWFANLSVIVLAAIVVVIGAHGEYGDRDVGGLVIHIYLVVALGIGFAISALLLTPGLKRLGHGWARINVILAVLWIVSAPIFFWLPTGWDGLYERGVAGIMIVWLLVLGRLLYVGATLRPRAALTLTPR